jgi:hypothetical protein
VAPFSLSGSLEGAASIFRAQNLGALVAPFSLFFGRFAAEIERLNSLAPA